MAGYHIRDQRALKISEITKPDRIQAHDRITKRRAEIPIGNFGNNKNPEDNTLPRYTPPQNHPRGNQNNKFQPKQVQK